MSTTIHLRHSNILFDPLHHDFSKVSIEDIAYGTAGQFRFGGQSRMTVAQHCVMASQTGDPAFALDKLMHDCAEGLGLTDIPSPLKNALFGTQYKKAENRLLLPASKKFGFTFPFVPEVKRVDAIMLHTEQRDFFGRQPKEGEIVLPDPIVPWSPQEAERRFLQRYRELTLGEEFTTRDYMKHIGMGRSAAQDHLNKLETQGLIERCSVMQLQSPGRIQKVVGWKYTGKRDGRIKGQLGRGR